MTKSIEEQAEVYAEKTYPIELVEFPKGHKQDVNHGRRGFSQRLFIEAAKARDAQWSAVVNELMAGIEFDLNYHACRTGDCPHEKQSECDKSIIDSTKELLIKSDQMLREMGVNND